MNHMSMILQMGSSFYLNNIEIDSFWLVEYWKKKIFFPETIGSIEPNIFINYCRWFLVGFFFISNPLLPTVHDIPLDQNRTYTNMCKRFIFINFKLYGPWPKFDFFLVNRTEFQDGWHHRTQDPVGNCFFSEIIEPYFLDFSWYGPFKAIIYIVCVDGQHWRIYHSQHKTLREMLK
jgi:hypothetical protein